MNTYDDVTQPVRLIIEGQETCPICTHTTLTETARMMRWQGTLYEITGFDPTPGHSSRGEWAFTMWLQEPMDDPRRRGIEAACAYLRSRERERAGTVWRAVRGAASVIAGFARAAIKAGSIGLEAVGFREGHNDAPDTGFAATKTRDQRGH